jgi:hypothetical protein
MSTWRGRKGMEARERKGDGMALRDRCEAAGAFTGDGEGDIVAPECNSRAGGADVKRLHTTKRGCMQREGPRTWCEHGKMSRGIGQRVKTNAPRRSIASAKLPTDRPSTGSAPRAGDVACPIFPPAGGLPIAFRPRRGRLQHRSMRSRSRSRTVTVTVTVAVTVTVCIGTSPPPRI